MQLAQKKFSQNDNKNWTLPVPTDTRLNRKDELCVCCVRSVSYKFKKERWQTYKNIHFQSARNKSSFFL